MPDEHIFEQHRISHNESKVRFQYFLITSAGVSLGFGLQALRGAPLSGTALLGHAALVVWLASIGSGLLWMMYSHRISHADIQVTRAKLSGASQESVDVIHDAIDQSTVNARWCQRAQWWLLFLGAALFVGHHFAMAAQLTRP